MEPEALHLPRLSELLETLPGETAEDRTGAAGDLRELLAALTQRPVPTGRLPRAWNLGGLQGHLVLGYLFCAARGLFADEERKRALRRDADLKAALRLLGTMGYLRGAVMKVGQALASYPEVVPDEVFQVMSSLHFEAPPMHYSLLREYLEGELGGDPEDVFAEFEPRAFAAASLGQVHRARLRTGEPVAVKVQYPGIGRTIRSDMANLRALIAPLRLLSDWHNLVEKADDVRVTLERETDYVQEAACAERVRAALADLDEVVVPRVFRDLSTEHVLVMDRLEGVHAGDFLRADPAQELRNRHGEQILRTSYRLWASDRLIFADPNPGNYLFLPDGRLGLLDFGCCRELVGGDWDVMLLGMRALREGGPWEDELIRVSCKLDEKDMQDAERMALLRNSMAWVWEPLRVDQPFDFPAEHMRRGYEILVQLTRRRYMRSMPVFTWLNRMFYGVRGLCHRLGARVPYARVDREELERAGV